MNLGQVDQINRYAAFGVVTSAQVALLLTVNTSSSNAAILFTALYTVYWLECCKRLLQGKFPLPFTENLLSEFNTNKDAKR